jgi:hypothetical protein
MLETRERCVSRFTLGRQRVTLACGIVAGLAISSTASAAGTFGLGPNPDDDPAFVSSHDVEPGSNSYFVEPDFDFHFDNDAGGWHKYFNAPVDGFQPGKIYTIHETFTFVPPPDGSLTTITDWHEIIEPGPDGNIWDIWMGGTISIDPMGQEPVPGLDVQIGPTGTDIWFFFDPIEVPSTGVTFHVWKDFEFQGDVPMDFPMVVTQYPTPTPGAAGLLAIAGVAATRRRR